MKWSFFLFPSKQSFIYLGAISCLAGLNQNQAKENAFSSKTQHSASGERPFDPKSSTVPLSHSAKFPHRMAKSLCRFY